MRKTRALEPQSIPWVRILAPALPVSPQARDPTSPSLNVPTCKMGIITKPTSQSSYEDQINQYKGSEENHTCQSVWLFLHHRESEIEKTSESYKVLCFSKGQALSWELCSLLCAAVENQSGNLDTERGDFPPFLLQGLPDLVSASLVSVHPPGAGRSKMDTWSLPSSPKSTPPSFTPWWGRTRGGVRDKMESRESSEGETPRRSA